MNHFYYFQTSDSKNMVETHGIFRGCKGSIKGERWQGGEGMGCWFVVFLVTTCIANKLCYATCNVFPRGHVFNDSKTGGRQSSPLPPQHHTSCAIKLMLESLQNQVTNLNRYLESG